VRVLDETDGETLSACEQIYEPLLAFGGTTEVIPALAESCNLAPIRLNGSSPCAKASLSTMAARWMLTTPATHIRSGMHRA
jgi:hypothetical protein